MAVGSFRLETSDGNANSAHQGMVLMRIIGMVAVAIGVLGAAAQPVNGQAVREWDSVRAYMTREALEDLREHLEKSASSSAYSATLRARTQEQAELISRRLQAGDFQLGDRIVLAVEDRPALSDTFTVDQGGVLTLPTVGDVPLTGVLRSELKQHISEFLGRFLREPVVRAQALIRIAIFGGVTRPGFYTFPGEALLTDAVMMAGGPAGNAKIDEMRIEREEVRIWEGKPLQAAMVGGRSLDQLNLRAGDRIFIPQRGAGFGSPDVILRTIGFALALPLTIVGLIQIF